MLAGSVPAFAQLGSVSNPPPQNLFNDRPTPKLDNGLGTYAQRRALLDRDRNGIVHRRRTYPAHRPVPLPNH